MYDYWLKANFNKGEDLRCAYSFYRFTNAGGEGFHKEGFEKIFPGFTSIPVPPFNPENVELSRKGLQDIFPKDIAYLADPIFNEDLTVSYYESAVKLKNSIRTKTKVGKFFKKLGPTYTDKQIEILVDRVKNFYKGSEDFEYLMTDEGEKIGEIYATPAASGFGINEYKSLSASCMRGNSFDSNQHPCSVYGSGDFELHYLKDGNKIAARVLVCKELRIFGPIYSISTLSGHSLKQKVLEIYPEYDYLHCPDWEGAKLLKVMEGDKYVAPYVDGNCQNARVKGEYLVLDMGGDIQLDSTDGYNKTYLYCEACDDDIRVGDSIVIDGSHYCPYCVSWCNFSNEYCLETVAVYFDRRSYDWCNENLLDRFAVYDNELEEYVTKDYAEQLEKGREEEEYE